MSTGASSPLLSLPPELHNRIYRHALLEAEVIPISDTTPPPIEPSILRACRQMRNEGIGLYYQENQFDFVIESFDPTPYLRFKVRSAQQSQVCGTFHFEGRSTWRDLLRWLKAYYDELLPAFPADNSEDDSAEIRVAFGMLRTVVKMMKAGNGWPVIEEVLEEVHKSIAVLDATWS